MRKIYRQISDVRYKTGPQVFGGMLYYQIEYKGERLTGELDTDSLPPTRYLFGVDDPSFRLGDWWR